MKRLMKRLGRIIGQALCIVLIIVLLPHASRLIDRLLPPLDGTAINTSVMLKREMENSARLETVRVNEEGVLNSSTSAIFLGEVQAVTVKYTYTASIGIDLTRVGLSIDGNVLTFTLPEPEILTDSLHPDEIVRDDFWYPLTDQRRQELLDSEQERLRSYYLTDYMSSDDMWQRTVSAFENTITLWMGQSNDGLIFKYEHEQDHPGPTPLG